MATETIPEGLTARQADVLRLTREGKNPTQIGEELGISSQGVHGHLRRLREKDLVPAANERTPRRAAPRVLRSKPADAMAAVRATAAEQDRQLAARLDEIEGEQDALKAEKAAIVKTRKELEALLPAEAS